MLPKSKIDKMESEVIKSRLQKLYPSCSITIIGRIKNKNSNILIAEIRKSSCEEIVIKSYNFLDKKKDCGRDKKYFIF
jgi:hypothetical protein